MNEEEWRDVPGFMGYRISSLGNVKSMARKHVFKAKGKRPTLRSVKERVLSPGTANGYPIVCLYRDGKPTVRGVHLLVLEAFIGPRPSGMQACHNDGNPANPRLDNLRWDTISNNHLDKHHHGTALLGAKNHMSKLTPKIVMEIRKSGQRVPELTRRFGVSRRAIRAVLARETWSHVE